MIARLLHLWERARSSLWFVPACMSAAAAVLAVVAAPLDAGLADRGEMPFFLYSGDRDGARELLATVAGSMITVAGVTFSVTVVALSLASSQFGPRLLVSFMRDPGNQLVLGTFIATFLFCLMALGTGGGTINPEAVPIVSTTLALLFAVASVAVLIYFIHHAASSMRAEHVIDVVFRDLHEAVERLAPREGAEALDPEDVDAPSPVQEPHRVSCVVTAPRDGYIQRVDEAGLVSIASEEDLLLRARRRPGHFVVEGEPLLRVEGRKEIAPKLAGRVQACFILGGARSHDQDPEYGVHQLVEIAVRALSPGVNDPYTALSCVDWLGAALCKVAERPLRSARHRDEGGQLRLVVDPITFDGMLAAAFNQIRQNAQATPAVSMRILEALARIGRRTRREDRRAAVRAQIEMIVHGARSEGLQESDREDLEARYRAALASIEGD